MRIRILSVLLSLLLLGKVSGQAGATLEILTPDVCVPGKVSMRVINCNSCISYDWEVIAGSGFKNASSDFSTIINDTGWIDVSVKLKTSAGAIILIGKKKAIYGRKAPTISFSVSQPLFCKAIDTLEVTDHTPNVKSRDWLIDGTVFYNGPATLKYSPPAVQGYKSIYLLVRDSWDCKGALYKDSAVSVWDSITAAVNPTKKQGCAPAYVDFAFDADTGYQRISSVFWGFQNGIPGFSNQRTAKNIYYDKGDTNDVFLKLTTDKGCTYSYRRNNLINFGDTSLLSIDVSKTKVCANEWITGKVYNTRTNNATWTFSNVDVAPQPLLGNDIKFQFKDTGVAQVLVYEDYKGCRSVALYNGNITVEGPLAIVAPESPFYCSLPKTLKFNNESIEYPGGSSWQWRIYDSTMTEVANSTTKNFSYYTTKGMRYSVLLKAIGANGCEDSMFLKPASSFGHIDTNLIIAPNPVCPGKSFTAIPKAGPGSKIYPNSYQWKFYDLAGNVVHVDYNEKPTFSYKNIGDYSVKMKVSNTDNCLDSVTLKDTIHVVAPDVELFVQDTFVCINQSIRITAKSAFNTSKMKRYWQMFNIDSLGVNYAVFADSANFVFYKTGHYRINYVIHDTTKNGCFFNYAFPNTVYVSGIQLKTYTDVNAGCPPLQINLSSKVLYNVNYEKSAGNNILYSWKPNKPLDVSLNSYSSANTPGDIYGIGLNFIKLVYSNESGCMDSTHLAVNTEFSAGFQLHGNVRCIGQIGYIYNESSPWATNFRYEADSSVIFSPNKFAKQPTVVFRKAGVFPIKQYISSGNCLDSITNYFEITDIKADFYTPDSVTYCAPRLINLINNTVGAFVNDWKFGDGDSARTYFNDIPGHLYVKNKTKPGYDIQLITKNQYGCSDTLLRKGYIRIIGPKPDFSVSNIVGCEPLAVSFKNNSADYSRMFVDYDNGVVLDSNILGTYHYKVTNKALMTQQFLPRILLYDSFGCSTLAYSKDTITVKKSAEALHAFTSIYFLRGTEGCAKDLLVKFTNKSRFFVKTWWDFDGDGTTEIINQNSPSYLFEKPGVFKPIIIAENVNGCRDTFQKDSITVFEKPSADFTTSTDTTCTIDPIIFKSKSVFTNPVYSYLWNFGELQLFTDSSTFPNTQWKYTAPFNHTVKLSIEDVKGCKDEKVKNIYVNDTAGPSKPELVLITVRDDNYVDFYWRRSALGNYLSYHTYLDSLGLWQRYQSYNRNDTVYSAAHGSDVFNRRFCYTLKVEDTCNQNGKAAVSHCTMVLRDTAIEPFHISLSWLAYDWWDTDLSHYEVFRKDPGSSKFNKIAEIKTNKLSYTDSFLCDKNYCYYVEAVHKNRSYVSRSNSVCRKPIFVKPDSFVNTTLVTVKNNSGTEVYWKPYYKYYRNWDYHLQRSSNGLPGSFNTILSTKGTSADDLNAPVQDRINYYRVLFLDHCAVPSNPGVVSNSIWLRFKNQNRNQTQIIWNAYNYWHSGVKSYGVQIKDSKGNFNNIKSLPPNITTLDSLNIESFQLDSICFRVYAVKDTSTFDTSWSNEVCLVPASYIHVPNAFTPNDDQLNENLKVVAGFIHKNSADPISRFEFRIYNRWGQMVYESFNPDETWNGYFDNRKCPTGLYVWSIKALGFDGVPHRLNGTVYLIR